VSSSRWNDDALSTLNHCFHDIPEIAGWDLAPELSSLDNRPYHPVFSAAMQQHFYGQYPLTPQASPEKWCPSMTDICPYWPLRPVPALVPAMHQGEESELVGGADPAQRSSDSKVPDSRASWPFEQGAVVVPDPSASNSPSTSSGSVPPRPKRQPPSDTPSNKSTVSDNDSAIDIRSVRATPPHDDLSKRRLALLKRWRRNDEPKKVFRCPSCAGEFTREDNLRRHQKTAHKKPESLKHPGIQNTEQSGDEGTVPALIPSIEHFQNGNDNDTFSPIHFLNAKTYALIDTKMVPESGTPCNLGSELDVPLFQESPQSQFSDLPRDPRATPKQESPFSDCGISEDFGGKSNFQSFGVDYVPDWSWGSSITPIDSDDLEYLFRPSKASSRGVQHEALKDSDHLSSLFRRARCKASNRFPENSPLRLSNVDTPSPSSARSSANEPLSPSTTPTTPESGGFGCAADLQSSSSGSNSSVDEWITSIDSRPESHCSSTSFSADCAPEGQLFIELGQSSEQPAAPPMDSSHESSAPDESSGGPISLGDVPLVHELRQCAPNLVLRTPFEQVERGDESINLNLSPSASERRLSTSTLSSLPLDSTPSKSDTCTASTTPQTTPAPPPVEYNLQITLPSNVCEPSSSPALVWRHVVLPWVCGNSQRILGGANPGGIEYHVLESGPTVYVTVQDITKVDKDFLEHGIQSLCDQYARDHNVSVNFEVKIEQGDVQRTGDHNEPRECPWPPNNGHFQPVPSCGACIGMGNHTTASLGGLIELEFGHGWEVFGLTCHHLLEDNIEGETGPGVKHGLLRGERVKPTFQPSRQQQDYRTHLLNRELATYKLLLEDDDEDYVSSEIRPRIAMIERKLHRQETDTLFGTIIHSSGFDRKTEEGQILDYALIGDIAPHRLNSANYVERPSDHFYNEPGQPITKIVNKRFFDDLLKSGCSERPTPDVTPPEPFTRVYGVGAVTGAQGGYLSTMPFFVNFEGFGEGSTEWSFAPYTPNGLGMFSLTSAGTTKSMKTEIFGTGKSGDSGAWIFDSFGYVMGMILGHNGRTGITYFTPMHCIFEDIKKLTGATAVRLRRPMPPKQSVPRDVQQFQALRGTGGGSTSPHDGFDGPWTPFSSSLRPTTLFPPEPLRTPGDGTPVSQGGDSAIGTIDDPPNRFFPSNTPCPEKRKLPPGLGHCPKRSRQQQHYERSPCGDSAVGISFIEEEEWSNAS
jgi:hypothetical protein